MSSATTFNLESDFIDKYSSDKTDRENRYKFLEQAKALSHPTRKHPDYKYTSMTEIIEADFTIEEATPDQEIELESLQRFENFILFIDGAYDEKRSKFDNTKFTVTTTKEQELQEFDKKNQNNYFYLRNRALCQTSLTITAKGSHAVAGNASTPLHILHLVTASSKQNSLHTGLLLNCTQDTAMVVLEELRYLTDEPTFHSLFTNINIGANAKLNHSQLYQASERALQYSNTHCNIKENGQYRNHNLQRYGKLSKNNITVELQQPRAHCDLLGLSTLKNNQHCDNFTEVRHLAANTNSIELYHSLVDDEATSVFQGKVYVSEDSQQIKADQMNRAILLSEKANANSMPQLEIFADDVQCSHGATVGQLNSEALFYLKTRGISNDEAQRMLTSAFADIVCVSIRNNKIYKEIQEIFKLKTN